MTRRCAILLLALLVPLLGAGCGVRPSGVITGLPAPTGPTEGTGPLIYFVADGQLLAIPRAIGGDPVAVLAAGPDANQRAQGLSTQVPAAAAPASVVRANHAFTVLLATDVTTLTSTAVDQIVCTVLAQRPVLVPGSGSDVQTVTLRGGGHTVQRGCPVAR
jgi:hypothetical protein